MRSLQEAKTEPHEPRVRVMDVDPSDAVEKTIEKSPSVKSVQPPPESRPARLVASIPAEAAEADKALEAKDYKRAGTLYDKLYLRKRLPADRIDQWGYCRLRAIMERINAGPKSTSEWNAIKDEVELIRGKAGPNLKWPLKYVDDVITERSNPKPTKRGSKPKLRGQSPEEPARSAARTKPTVATKPSASTVAQTGNAAIGKAAGKIGPWQVWSTGNFRILHSNEELARKIATVAERTRKAQAKKWIDDKAAESVWSPVCDIFVYPDLRSYTEATGQTDVSPGFSTVGQQDGRIVDRRINIHADNARLLTAVLPHEVTHIVIADVFPDRPIPLWADEGIALLSEPDAEQRLRSATPEAELKRGRLFRLHDLMTMDYPAGEHWDLYFAQSTTLTRYLVEKTSPREFVQYLKISSVSGYEKPLKSTFGIADFAELERRRGRVLSSRASGELDSREDREAVTPGSLRAAA